jgi:hypothetical protein
MGGLIAYCIQDAPVVTIQALVSLTSYRTVMILVPVVVVTRP